MAKCLVLGASGFIGSHLVDALATQGHDVRAFGRFTNGPQFIENSRIECYYGDFLNRNDLIEALKGIEYVFHFISTTTPASAENDPLIDVETNVRMSIELFELCVEAGVKRVLFASTGGSIYGEGGDVPLPEDYNPLPVSPYAIGKLTIEHYLRYFRVKHGLDSVSFRISNPYGERQVLHRRQGVIPIFLENIVKDKPLTVMGDGTMVRDYVYVKDVASMVASVFAAPTKHATYNLGSGTGKSVNEIVAAMELVSGKRAIIEQLDTPSTFVHKVILDTARFNDEFNLHATTSLQQGLQATYEYITSELTNK